MKLYATTTSERASKGQGGNLFISVDLSHDKIPLAKIMLDAHGFLYIKGAMEIEWRKVYIANRGILEDITDVNKTKGKSQKGECVHGKSLNDKCEYCIVGDTHKLGY